MVRVCWNSALDCGDGVRERVIDARNRNEVEMAGFWAPVVRWAVQERWQGVTLTRRDAERLL